MFFKHLLKAARPVVRNVRFTYYVSNEQFLSESRSIVKSHFNENPIFWQKIGDQLSECEKLIKHPKSGVDVSKFNLSGALLNHPIYGGTKENTRKFEALHFAYHEAYSLKP